MRKSHGLFVMTLLATIALALQAQVINPGRLSVSPLAGFASSGQAGGPFAPPNMTYTLSNVGDEGITWSSSNTENWVTVAPPGGSLAAGGSVDVTVSINANANSLPPGTYSDTLTFTNVTGGMGTTTRTVTLTVSSGPPPTITIDPAPPSVTDASPLIVSGTASPGAPEFMITEIIWSNVNANWSWAEEAGGTSSWVAQIPLVPGENDITITAYDSGGGRASTFFIVIYQPPPGARGGGGGGGRCGATGVEAMLLMGLLYLRRRRA